MASAATDTRQRREELDARIATLQSQLSTAHSELYELQKSCSHPEDQQSAVEQYGWRTTTCAVCGKKQLDPVSAAARMSQAE